MNNKFARLLAIVPAMILMTIANVFIEVSVAGVVFLQLISNGTNKYIAITMAALVAIVVYLYIRFNHKIKEYVDKNVKGDTTNE